MRVIIWYLGFLIQYMWLQVWHQLQNLFGKVLSDGATPLVLMHWKHIESFKVASLMYLSTMEKSPGKWIKTTSWEVINILSSKSRLSWRSNCTSICLAWENQESWKEECPLKLRP